jgi:hypothetical protein
MLCGSLPKEAPKRAIFHFFHGGIANQALEATSARDEGEDGREKSVKRKKRILIEIR